MRWLGLLPLLLGGGASAAENSIDVCYNYACAVEESVIFSDARMDWVRDMMALAKTPEREREVLAVVVGQLYAWAGEQTPIWHDRGGNYDDEELDGRMDCIDHSTTTTRFLRMIAKKGWLRFHRVQKPRWRSEFLLLQHYSAVIEELGPVRDPAHPKPERYVVDSWFRDNGQPAVVIPYEKWRAGASRED